MLFFIPLLAVTTLLQALIPGVPTPGTFVTIDAAARGTDVSLWILHQCPSTATTFAELELALQLGSTDPLVYSVPLGLHVWRSFPSVRAWGRTLVTSVDRLLSASRVKLNYLRHSARHMRVPRLEALPNGTSPGWRTYNDRPGRPGHVYLALAMAQIGLPLPTVLTLPAPALVLSLPAPRPILALPAPAPILALPAPAPVLSITIPGIALTSPTPTSTHTLPAPRPVFIQPPVKASPTFKVIPTSSATNLGTHVPPSPGTVPFCAQPTSAAPMALSSKPASKSPATFSMPTRGFYPVTTKPVAHSTARKWHSHLCMACLVVLTLGFHLAASRSLEGLVRHLVGADYDIPGERDELDPFGGLTIDMSDTAGSGILGGLAPHLFRFCGQPEPVDTTFGDGISDEDGELEQVSDPFNKLVIDTLDVERSGRLGGLAPDLFRFCDEPELPDAALGDALDDPLGSKGETEGTNGEDAGEEAPEDAPVEMEPAGENKMDGATASCDIPVDDEAHGLPKDVPGPGQSVDELELESALEVEVEARDGCLQVDTADSVGDSPGGLEDPLRPGRFDWSDEPLESNDTVAVADATSRAVDLQAGLEEPDQPEAGPSNLESRRQGAQYGGAGTSSSRWAPQGDGGWRGGYRGGQGSGSRGGGSRNGGRGGGYGGGNAYSGGGRGRYGGSGGYSGGRGGNGGGSSGSGGGEGREGRSGNRRESKASYFVRLRKEQKAAAQTATEN